MSESQVMLKEILQIGGICSSQKLWKTLLHFPVKSNNLNVQNLILYKLWRVVQIVIQCSQLLLCWFRFVQGMCSQGWGWNCVDSSSRFSSQRFSQAGFRVPPHLWLRGQAVACTNSYKDLGDPFFWLSPLQDFL